MPNRNKIREGYKTLKINPGKYQDYKGPEEFAKQFSDTGEIVWIKDDFGSAGIINKLDLNA
jgi:hypothetical protein